MTHNKFKLFELNFKYILSRSTKQTNNNNNLSSKISQVNLGRIKCIQTLLLPHSNKEIIFKRLSIQIYQLPKQKILYN